jgi:hypothetical protein
MLKGAQVQPADIVQQLRDACTGHPNATVPWPHRLLHNAADEIERRREYGETVSRKLCDSQSYAEALERELSALRRAVETTAPATKQRADWEVLVRSGLTPVQAIAMREDYSAEIERLIKLSTQFQRDNASLISRLAKYESRTVETFGERTAEDFAIEYGGYLASAATDFIEASNEMAKAYIVDIDVGQTERQLDADHSYSDGMRRLRTAIYEFNKRADRAALITGERIGYTVRGLMDRLDLINSVAHRGGDTLDVVREIIQLSGGFARPPVKATATHECLDCFGEGAIPMSTGYERRTCSLCNGTGRIDLNGTVPHE